MGEPQMDWQTWVALAIVLIAVALLVRKGWQIVFGTGHGCGTSCDGCPAASAKSSPSGLKVTKLVQLDSQNPHVSK